MFRPHDVVTAKTSSGTRLHSRRALLESWLKTRLASVRSRAENELKELREQQHMLEGYQRAAQLTGEIVSLLQRSVDQGQAVKALTSAQLLKCTDSSLRILTTWIYSCGVTACACITEPPFGFSETQAQGILRLKLSSLTKLHRREQTAQLNQLEERIARVECLLAEEPRLREVVKNELAALAEKYGTPRKTQSLASLKSLLDAAEDAQSLDLKVAEEILTFPREGASRAVGGSSSARSVAELKADLRAERKLLAEAEGGGLGGGGVAEEAVDETEFVPCLPPEGRALAAQRLPGNRRGRPLMLRFSGPSFWSRSRVSTNACRSPRSSDSAEEGRWISVEGGPARASRWRRLLLLPPAPLSLQPRRLEALTGCSS